MEDLIANVSEKLEEYSANTVGAAIDELSRQVTASENVNEKTKNKLKKTLVEFKEIVLANFSEIDKKELLELLAEIATKISKNDEKSFIEAQNLMEKFMKKYKKKKFIFF
ncbi:hypothetical protein WDU94_014364 [Cyamophila willieti]